MTEEEIDWYMLAASQKYEVEAGSVASGKSHPRLNVNSTPLRTSTVKSSLACLT